MMASQRVVLKQYRFELMAAILGALTVVALWFYVLWQIRDINFPQECIRTTSAGIASACVASVDALQEAAWSLSERMSELMRIVPFAAGLLVGVPIVARELETGTAQTAWSLYASRRRWLARQATMVGFPVLLAVCLAALGAAHVESLRQASGGGEAVLRIGGYGLPAVIRGLAAFAIGVLLGALLARSVPALVLGALLCFALIFAVGAVRDDWLARQPSSPIPDGVMTSMTTGWAYQTPEGLLIAESEAMALVPGDVAAKDEGQAQPVYSGIWLEGHGYILVPVGVSQEAAMGWERYDMLIFGGICLAAVGASSFAVERRRPV